MFFVLSVQNRAGPRAGPTRFTFLVLCKHCWWGYPKSQQLLLLIKFRTLVILEHCDTMRVTCTSCTSIAHGMPKRVQQTPFQCLSEAGSYRLRWHYYSHCERPLTPCFICPMATYPAMPRSLPRTCVARVITGSVGRTTSFFLPKSARG